MTVVKCPLLLTWLPKTSNTWGTKTSKPGNNFETKQSTVYPKKSVIVDKMLSLGLFKNSSVPMSTSDLPILPLSAKPSTSGRKSSTGMPKASISRSPATQKPSRASPIEEEKDDYEAKGSSLQEL